MITEKEHKALVDSTEYPSVVGSGETETVARAIDNVYKVVDEEIDDEAWKENLTMIPAEFCRGPESVSEARQIINEVEHHAGTIDAIEEACEESLELLEDEPEPTFSW